MTPQEFFVAACKAGRYKEKAWVYSVLGVTITLPNAIFRDYDVIRRDGKATYWLNGQQNDFDAKLSPLDPILGPKDPVHLEPGDIPNLTKPTDTIIGNLLVNWYCIVYPFGRKIPFLEGEITISRVEKLIAPRLVSDILTDSLQVDTESEDPNAIYVHEYVKYISSALALAGFAEVSVPAATPYTAMTSPAVAKRRKELLTEFKDQLGDLSVIANIEKELIKLDEEWIAQDPDKGFLIKSKSFKVARKKQFIMAGAEQSFRGDGSITLVDKPLSDGMDIRAMPDSINTLRDGVYNRASNTALGGEAVKFFQRVLQNVKISMEDCGVEYGIPTLVTKENKGIYYGMFFKVGGSWIELTDESYDSVAGKYYQRRTPGACKAPDTDFCAKCMGTRVSSSPLAMSAFGASLGDALLYVFMQAMHGKALETRTYDIKRLIS